MQLITELFGLVSDSRLSLFDWSLAPIIARSVIPVIILLLGIIKQGLKLGKYLIIAGVILLALPYAAELIHRVLDIIETFT